VQKHHERAVLRRHEPAGQSETIRRSRGDLVVHHAVIDGPLFRQPSRRNRIGQQPMGLRARSPADLDRDAGDEHKKHDNDDDPEAHNSKGHCSQLIGGRRAAWMSV
jgi:hypothetical protein